jgi:uncharacterized RDD family membrane protein YckC
MRGMIFCKRCGNYAADGLDACPKCSVSLSESGHSSMVGGLIVNARPAPASAGIGSAGAMFGSSSMEPAGHGQRIVALIIDSILIALIAGIGFAGLIFVGDIAGLLILGVVCLVAAAYEPYFIATKGATPGKSAMGLRVVDKDGGPVSVGQSIGRFLLKNILNQLFIPIFVPLFTARRQGLHEMATSTYLIRA